MGGPDDWRALFHEAGHTEHYAHTSADLSVEERRLGDNAVTEGWAMLFEHLVGEPAWLNRRLDVPRAERLRLGECGRAPLLRAALLGEAALRARVPRRGGRDVAARPLRRAALRRGQDRAEPDRLPRRHRRRLLRQRRTCARGPSRRSSGTSCARSSGMRGSLAARPAGCCASSGRSASSRPPRSCSRT